MSSSNKKPKTLTASSLCNMATKHVTRVQTAEKASCSSKPTGTSNAEVNTLSGQHNVLSEPYNVLSEDYTTFKVMCKILEYLLEL